MTRGETSIRPAPSADRQGAAPNGDHGATTFVNRERELGELTRLLDAALAGRGGLVMVCGEPGIGKTRVLNELAERADERGAVCVWGRCWDAGGAPAYWPWIQIVRTLMQRFEPAELREYLGPGAAYIAQVVPDLRDRFPDIAETGSLASQPIRFSLLYGAPRRLV